MEDAIHRRECRISRRIDEEGRNKMDLEFKICHGDCRTLQGSMLAYRAHAFQCRPSESPCFIDRGLPELAPVAGERRYQGSPMVQELVGMVPDNIHVLMQELCICLSFSGYGAANKECQLAVSLVAHTLGPVKSSRHVKAEEKLEVRLQLFCDRITISYTCFLPIFTSNIQCEGIAVDIVFVTHHRSSMESWKLTNHAPVPALCRTPSH
jgi:hypothetical protein